MTLENGQISGLPTPFQRGSDPRPQGFHPPLSVERGGWNRRVCNEVDL